ncbi:MAG: hypothetical protein IPK19_14795 [Chloroflexi bacterium]|nr:hypothetical protein [Chloroflexota bacterium]
MKQFAHLLLLVLLSVPLAFVRAQSCDPNAALETSAQFAERGNACLGAANYDQALSDLTRAIELDAASAEPYRIRGMVYAARGEKERAVADFYLYLAKAGDAANPIVQDQIRTLEMELGSTPPADIAANNTWLLLVLIAGTVVAVVRLSRLFQPRRSASSGSPPRGPFREQEVAALQRAVENERRYALNDIPAAASQLTLLRFRYHYRDESYTFVYLLPGREPIPRSTTSALDLFAIYSDARRRAIWAYRGDNLADRMTENRQKEISEQRFASMKKVLESGGWREVERHSPVDSLHIAYLSR